MLTKVLKITTGGLIVLGGYVFAYRYGYIRGLLDLQMTLEEDYKERKKRGYKSYYHRSTKPRDDVFILETRDEAERALSDLRYLHSKYGYVTVTDYKSLIGIENEPCDNRLGWTDLSSAEIICSFDGWTVVLSEPKKLD